MLEGYCYNEAIEDFDIYDSCPLGKSSCRSPGTRWEYSIQTLSCLTPCFLHAETYAAICIELKKRSLLQ